MARLLAWLACCVWPREQAHNGENWRDKTSSHRQSTVNRRQDPGQLSASGVLPRPSAPLNHPSEPSASAAAQAYAEDTEAHKQRALRDQLLVEATTSIITVFDLDGGAVRHQNALSKEFFGERSQHAQHQQQQQQQLWASGAAGVTDASLPLLCDVEPALPPLESGLAPLLLQLFAYEPEKLQAMLDRLAEGPGRVWRGVLRVPSGLVAAEAAQQLLLPEYCDLAGGLSELMAAADIMDLTLVEEEGEGEQSRSGPGRRGPYAGQQQQQHGEELAAAVVSVAAIAAPVDATRWPQPPACAVAPAVSCPDRGSSVHDVQQAAGPAGPGPAAPDAQAQQQLGLPVSQQVASGGGGAGGAVSVASWWRRRSDDCIAEGGPGGGSGDGGGSNSRWRSQAQVVAAETVMQQTSGPLVQPQQQQPQLAPPASVFTQLQHLKPPAVNTAVAAVIASNASPAAGVGGGVALRAAVDQRTLSRELSHSQSYSYSYSHSRNGLLASYDDSAPQQPLQHRMPSRELQGSMRRAAPGGPHQQPPAGRPAATPPAGSSRPSFKSSADASGRLLPPSGSAVACGLLLPLPTQSDHSAVEVCSAALLASGVLPEGRPQMDMIAEQQAAVLLGATPGHPEPLVTLTPIDNDTSGHGGPLQASHRAIHYSLEQEWPWPQRTPVVGHRQQRQQHTGPAAAPPGAGAPPLRPVRTTVLPTLHPHAAADGSPASCFTTPRDWQWQQAGSYPVTPAGAVAGARQANHGGPVSCGFDPLDTAAGAGTTTTSAAAHVVTGGGAHQYNTLEDLLLNSGAGGALATSVLAVTLGRNLDVARSLSIHRLNLPASAIAAPRSGIMARRDLGAVAPPAANGMGGGVASAAAGGKMCIGLGPGVGSGAPLRQLSMMDCRPPGSSGLAAGPAIGPYRPLRPQRSSSSSTAAGVYGGRPQCFDRPPPADLQQQHQQPLLHASQRLLSRRSLCVVSAYGADARPTGGGTVASQSYVTVGGPPPPPVHLHDQQLQQHPHQHRVPTSWHSGLSPVGGGGSSTTRLLPRSGSLAPLSHTPAPHVPQPSRRAESAACLVRTFTAARQLQLQQQRQHPLPIDLNSALQVQWDGATAVAAASSPTATAAASNTHASAAMTGPLLSPTAAASPTPASAAAGVVVAQLAPDHQQHPAAVGSGRDVGGNFHTLTCEMLGDGTAELGGDEEEGGRTRAAGGLMTTTEDHGSLGLSLLTASGAAEKDRCYASDGTSDLATASSALCDSRTSRPAAPAAPAARSSMAAAGPQQQALESLQSQHTSASPLRPAALSDGWRPAVAAAAERAAGSSGAATVIAAASAALALARNSCSGIAGCGSSAEMRTLLLDSGGAAAGTDGTDGIGGGAAAAVPTASAEGGGSLTAARRLCRLADSPTKRPPAAAAAGFAGVVASTSEGSMQQHSPLLLKSSHSFPQPQQQPQPVGLQQPRQLSSPPDVRTQSQQQQQQHQTRQPQPSQPLMLPLPPLPPPVAQAWPAGELQPQLLTGQQQQQPYPAAARRPGVDSVSPVSGLERRRGLQRMASNKITGILPSGTRVCIADGVLLSDAAAAAGAAAARRGSTAASSVTTAADCCTQPGSNTASRTSAGGFSHISSLDGVSPLLRHDDSVLTDEAAAGERALQSRSLPATEYDGCSSQQRQPHPQQAQQLRPQERLPNHVTTAAAAAAAAVATTDALPSPFTSSLGVSSALAPAEQQQQQQPQQQRVMNMSDLRANRWRDGESPANRDVEIGATDANWHQRQQQKEQNARCGDTDGGEAARQAGALVCPPSSSSSSGMAAGGSRQQMAAGGSSGAFQVGASGWVAAGGSSRTTQQELSLTLRSGEAARHVLDTTGTSGGFSAAAAAAAAAFGVGSSAAYPPAAAPMPVSARSMNAGGDRATADSARKLQSGCDGSSNESPHVELGCNDGSTTAPAAAAAAAAGVTATQPGGSGGEAGGLRGSSAVVSSSAGATAACALGVIVDVPRGIPAANIAGASGVCGTVDSSTGDLLCTALTSAAAATTHTAANVVTVAGASNGGDFAVGAEIESPMHTSLLDTLGVMQNVTASGMTDTRVHDGPQPDADSGTKWGSGGICGGGGGGGLAFARGSLTLIPGHAGGSCSPAPAGTGAEGPMPECLLLSPFIGMPRPSGAGLALAGASCSGASPGSADSAAAAVAAGGQQDSAAATVGAWPSLQQQGSSSPWGSQPPVPPATISRGADSSGSLAAAGPPPSQQLARGAPRAAAAAGHRAERPVAPLLMRIGSSAGPVAATGGSVGLPALQPAAGAQQNYHQQQQQFRQRLAQQPSSQQQQQRLLQQALQQALNQRRQHRGHGLSSQQHASTSLPLPLAAFGSTSASAALLGVGAFGSTAGATAALGTAPPTYHRITATRCVDPGSGRECVVVVQDDVSAKVAVERHLALHFETEHRLLEQIFPKHILRALTDEAVMAQEEKERLVAALAAAQGADVHHMSMALATALSPRAGAGAGASGRRGGSLVSAGAAAAVAALRRMHQHYNNNNNMNISNGASMHGGEHSAHGGGSAVMAATAQGSPVASTPLPVLSASGLSARAASVSERLSAGLAGSARRHGSVSGGMWLRPAVREGCNALATFHPRVTLLFADVKGFTPMCRQVEPHTVMTMLNDLFSRFDSQLDKYGVRKVETIGDAYFVAGGLTFEDSLSEQADLQQAAADVGEEDGPIAAAAANLHARTHSNGLRRRVDGLEESRRHATQVIGFAKALLEAARQVPMPTSGEPVQIRVGVHTGPCVSGVVGSKMPRFCLFGAAVATAARMESSGEAGAVHVSETTYGLLPEGEQQSGEWVPRPGGVQVRDTPLQSFLWRPLRRA